MSNFNVTKLMFIETGSYHQQAARPYNTYIDDTRNVSLLKNATQDGSNISANSVAGVASTILRPSSEAGRDINITQGWNERRYRFFMEIELMVGNIPTRKIIIGYTDHVGKAPFSDHLDPNMRMYINNVIVLRMMGMGQWQIWESNHIIVNDLIVHGGGFQNQSVVMRPEDVFNNLQATNFYPQEEVKMHDFRAIASTGARKSERVNTNHNQYLAKSMKALHSAQNNVDHMQGNQADIFNEATTKVREASFVDDTLLRNWDDQGNYFEEGYITYGLLCDLSPSTLHVTQHFELSPPLKQASAYTENTEHFKGSDVTSIMATILSNTVPPLAMECLLTKVKFSATNATVNGQPHATLTDVPRGFVQDIPLDRYIQLFLDRLENIVMPDVTNNWNFIVTLDMEVDILGETKISIQVNNEPPVPYVIPSFADGLTAPIIGNNNNDLSSLASDIYAVTNTVGMATEQSSNIQVFGSADSSKW